MPDKQPVELVKSRMIYKDLEQILGEDTRDYLLYRQGSGTTVEILDIVVGSERRKGVGRNLINQLLGLLPVEVKLVFAITRSDNFIAQQFYESLHFRVVGVLRNFYQDTPGVLNQVDAVMYGLDRSGSS